MKLDRIIAVRSNKTIYRDGENCIKVFNSDFSKADVLNEALNQARIEDIGLNIPKIKEVMMIDGKWAIVSEYISGKTIQRMIEINPQKKMEYLKMFVELQMQVHSKHCSILIRLKDKMNRKIDSTNLNSTTKYEMHTLLEGMPRHCKVCHGDFNLSNVIITNDGVPFIIDWAHVTQGNASADVARTYLLFRLNGDIAGANDYLNLFSEMSNTEKRYVQKWMPLVAAAYLPSAKENERKFLMNWIDVVDYE